MHKHDKTVGYKQYLVSSNEEDVQDVITTVVIDEVHNRSAHSDYVLALTLAAMQKHSHLRLVLMSATGDHSLVGERIPHCQQLVMKGVMHHVKRCFLDHPLDQAHNLLNLMAQICDHLSQ